MPKVTQKNKGRKLFAARLKAIRPYVDFDYNLNSEPTKSQKAKVRRYYEEITALRNRPYQVYRPRRADRLRPAQQFAQHEKLLPGIKVAFIPTDGKSKVRLRFRGKGDIVAKSEHVSISSVELSRRGLAGDTERYVRGRISSNPAKNFTIQAGRYEIPVPYLPDSVPAAVLRLVERYGGPQLSDPEERENHNWQNWLFGLNAYHFENQSDIEEYLNGKRETIKSQKRERDRARKRRQRLESKKSNT
jgi:hypothetical protein